jgi:hypothetical protein
MKYLLLKIKKRTFLTHEKNLNSLIEFAKTFSAEIHLIESETQKVLELKALANAICNQEYSVKPKAYQEVKKIFPIRKRDRETILKNAKKIQRFIHRRLTNGKPISLKELKQKYQYLGVTDACLCSHLSVARKYVSDKGYQIRKLGAGTYVAEKSNRKS